MILMSSFVDAWSMILGLRINLHKSLLNGVGMDLGKVQSIASLLSCQITSLSIRYLGLQLGGKRRDN